MVRGRKPGSLHSADSGRDDTKKAQRIEDDASASPCQGEVLEWTLSDELSSEGGVSGGQGHREHSGRGLYVTQFGLGAVVGRVAELAGVIEGFTGLLVALAWGRQRGGVLVGGAASVESGRHQEDRDRHDQLRGGGA